MFEITLKVKFLIFVKTIEQTQFALISAEVVEYFNITHVALMYFKINSLLLDTSIYICDQIIHIKSGHSQPINLCWCLKVGCVKESDCNLKGETCLWIWLSNIKRPLVIVSLVVEVTFNIGTVGNSQSVNEGIVAYRKEYSADYQ